MDPPTDEQVNAALDRVRDFAWWLRGCLARLDARGVPPTDSMVRDLRRLLVEIDAMRERSSLWPPRRREEPVVGERSMRARQPARLPDNVDPPAEPC